MRVSAVIVSRMNVPIGPVIESIQPHVEEIIIARGDGGVYQRYSAAATGARCDIVYTQDDDCIVDVAAVLAAYEPGLVTCNMPAKFRPHYPDGIALVGFGCVFYRPAALRGPAEFDAFKRYAKVGFFDDLFHREADRVFTGLSPLKLIDVRKQDCWYALGQDRMGTERRHGDDLAAIRKLIYAARAKDV